jgi:F-type H+-transporting ATPase subunit b
MKRTIRRWLAVALWAGMLVCARPIVGRAAQPVRAPMAVVVLATSSPSNSHANLLDLINLVLLIAVLVYFLRKPLGQFFSTRSREIEEGLEKGRKALESAQAQLAAADEKLRNVEGEITELKEAAARETEAERERMRRLAEQEAQRIIDSARSVIESTAQAAKLDLRRFAARQAGELAEELLRQRLNDASRDRLVARFLEDLPNPSDHKPPA